MAIGDIYEVPLKVKNFAIKLPAGQSSVNYNVKYPLLYKRDEWELDAVAIGVTCRQTYTPAPLQPGIVTLDNFAALKTVNANTETPIELDPIEWNVFDAGSTKSTSGVNNVDLLDPNIFPQEVSIVVEHTYNIPVIAVSEQTANMTVEISIVAIQRVENPTTTPAWGNEEETGTGKPDPDPIPDDILILLGIGSVGLIAALFLVRELRPERAFAGDVSRDVRSAVKSRKS